jgi:gluconate 2-dehydrogenase gamma chain
MTVLDRRGLLASAGLLLGAEVVAPLARALAADAVPGFTASQPQFTPDQRALVSAISERIIPTTDTPGAITAGVPAFIEMMLADWYAPQDRDDFLNGMGVIDGHAWVQYEKAFAELAPEQQDAILTLAMQGRLGGDFFGHCRQLVVLGYYTSEAGCKQERVYVPVPGHYDGKYPYAEVRRVFSS